MTKKNKKLLTLILFLIFNFILTNNFLIKKIQSANLTSASVTLSNSRLSFHGILDSGNSVGSTTVSINTTGTAHKTSKSTAQLEEGDTVAIGNNGTLSTYTINSTDPASEFTITSGLGSGDADANDDVIATQSSTLTVRFTTATAIANGRFRILVPALSDDNLAADGIPDSDKFDFSTTTPTVTCPDDLSGYDFVSGTATASAITINNSDYHAFECAYYGSGAASTAFDGSSQNAITIASLINPSPESSHSLGTADRHNIIIQHINSDFAVTDSIVVSVGVIEAVKVTASIAQSISFTISAVNSGISTCGVTTDVTTTASTVPFGTLSLSSFREAAQTLTVTTNAIGGYVVTARENDQLGLAGAACVGDNTGNNCIRDAAGDTGTMTHIVADEFNSTNTKGFAYSLDNADATSPAFEYTDTDGGCGGTFCAKQFADNEDSQSAQTIFGSSSVAENENLNVCYRIIPASTTTAGDYQNTVTYTATATF